MHLFFLVLCVHLYSSSCSANKGVQTAMRAATRVQSVTLQPWLVGLTAVVGFLFIVFTVLIVHRLLKKNGEDEEGLMYNRKADGMDEDDKQTSL